MSMVDTQDVLRVIAEGMDTAGKVAWAEACRIGANEIERLTRMVREHGDEIMRSAGRENMASISIEYLREQRDALLRAARVALNELETVEREMSGIAPEVISKAAPLLRESIKLAEESPLGRAVRIARGDPGPPTEPVEFS